MKRLLSWIGKNEFLLVVMCLTALLRLPSIFEPNWYGDEGIYLVLGKALSSGLVWYRDIHDNKPPLLYLLAALTGSVLWFRTLLLIWMVATVAVFDKLAKRWLAGWQARVALVIFALMTSLPLIEGNIANAEIYMILPTLLGVWYLAEGKSLKSGFFAGVAFGLAFLFKIPAFFEFAGLMLFIYFIGVASLREAAGFWKNRRFWLTVAGFALPVTITIIYYAAVGSLAEYISAAFFQNIGYLSSWRTGSVTRSGLSTQSGLLVRGVILVILVVPFAIWSGKLERWFRLTWIWFIFALFGALLSERPYPHYLIQTVASGSLLLAGMLTKKIGLVLASLAAVAVLGLGIWKYKFYSYPVVPYYKNFFAYIWGQLSREKYGAVFDWRVPRTEEAGSFIKQVTRQGERIFIWGDEPFIYLRANRMPVGKYMVAYHLIDFEARTAIIDQLIAERPRVIVIAANEQRPFTELSSFLATRYVLVKNIDGLLIYLRLNQT